MSSVRKFPTYIIENNIKFMPSRVLSGKLSLVIEFYARQLVETIYRI